MTTSYANSLLIQINQHCERCGAQHAQLVEQMDEGDYFDRADDTPITMETNDRIDGALTTVEGVCEDCLTGEAKYLSEEDALELDFEL